jgi:rod shape-determining protein MreD
MRKNLLWAFTVILAAMLETTWIENIRYLDVVPDLSLIMVIYFAIADGEERAMFTGAIGGLFQDIATNSTLGHHVLCHVVIGYIAGRIATRLITDHPAVKSGLVFCASIVSGLLSILILYVQDPSIPATVNILARVVPGAFYTALFTPVMFIVLDRVFPKKELALEEGIA